MEHPSRPCGDVLLRPGEMSAVRARLRALAAHHDLTSVIACAFDRRTRVLPFIFGDVRIAPAGVRAIGASLHDSGFTKTRIVLQQWNRRFRPSRMRLDGRVPDLFLVSSMHIHSAQCRAMIEDAWRIDPAHRPLIIAGGPKAIHEPWDLFNSDPANPSGADLAVTGEDYVLLNLLEVLLEHRGAGESMRSAFARARQEGALDQVAGLVYARTGPAGEAQELVNTGPQRLLGDLDELPDPVQGFLLLEPPSRSAELASAPMPASQVRKHSPINSLVLTLGCKYSCPYCPIPAYNQHQLRFKSPQRIAQEVGRLYSELGMRHFFGADDNFFNDRRRSMAILEALATAQVNGEQLHRRIRWGTEATVADTLKMGSDLRLARKAGIRALWLGVEDMSGRLVKKGQTADRSLEAFRLLHEHSIVPMAMMMHHDAQPLLSRGRPDGLINQVRLLRKAGAVTMQVLMITPAAGSKIYEDTFTSGMVFRQAGGRQVEPYMFDGNYVVASHAPRPSNKQWNILAAYLWFYNPLRMLWALVRPKSSLYLLDSGAQVLGMLGLACTAARTIPWALRLMFGRIARTSRPPGAGVPYRRVGPKGQ